MKSRVQPGERLRVAAEKQAAILARTPAGATISAVAPVARSTTRCSIRVGGRIVARLEADAVRELGISVGDPWSPALAQRILERTGFERYKAHAMRSLALRPLSRRDLVNRLAARGAGSAIAERVAQEMESAGFLNDAAYAEALVRSVTRSRPAGSRLLESKLRAKGVEREAAAAAVRKAASESDPLAEAIILASRRARLAPPKLDPRARARRLLGLLARRGFAPGVAAEAVRRALELAKNGIPEADTEF